MMDCAKTTAYSLGYVLVTKRSKNYKNGFIWKVHLMCDRSGKYDRLESSIGTSTKKTDCPFQLIGQYSSSHGYWTIRVVCDQHNHLPTQNLEGHAYARRLSDDEYRLVEDLTWKNVRPQIFHPHIIDFYVVRGDGNCGFRSVALGLGLSEDQWHQVRSDLVRELTAHREQYNRAQQEELESDVTREEIKRAVWDCGVDKSPGPDGFTFGFYHQFWDLVEKDVISVVNYFFKHGEFSSGCNSSFIALISKIPNANMVKDFRPISRIGSLYKIITKVLANRLALVLSVLVHEAQSAFVSGRQIMDGPFILNE
nr:RNA-directed DNA polymerase, eukaryota, reverse transcriptase zinc-binding domain protein [Tanacetum cinerariifolium]